MLIAHVSDTHVFSREPETPLVRRDAARVARRLAADLAAFTPALDAVAFTGDLTDGGASEDYALLVDILAPLSMPVFVTPGNHDRRQTLRRAFAARLPFDESGFLNYEVDLGPLRIVALDTLVEGHVEGALHADSLAWLGRKLSTATGQTTLVLMHHPPFPSGVAALDRMALVGGREETARIVRECPGRLILLAGHVHRPYQAIWNGAFCAVAGSPAFQIALDLGAGPHEPPSVREPYAYYVYRIENDSIAVHTRYVRLDD